MSSVYFVHSQRLIIQVHTQYGMKLTLSHAHLIGNTHTIFDLVHFGQPANLLCQGFILSLTHLLHTSSIRVSFIWRRMLDGLHTFLVCSQVGTIMVSCWIYWQIVLEYFNFYHRKHTPRLSKRIAIFGNVESYIRKEVKSRSYSCFSSLSESHISTTSPKKIKSDIT